MCSALVEGELVFLARASVGDGLGDGHFTPVAILRCIHGVQRIVAAVAAAREGDDDGALDDVVGPGREGVGGEIAVLEKVRVCRKGAVGTGRGWGSGGGAG